MAREEDAAADEGTRGRVQAGRDGAMAVYQCGRECVHAGALKWASGRAREEARGHEGAVLG